MVSLPRDYEALVPVQGRRHHTLHAIYARSCLPVVEELLAEGRRKVLDLLPKIRLRALTRKEWGTIDPLGLSFFNVNGPQDLALAQEIWRQNRLSTKGPSTRVHG